MKFLCHIFGHKIRRESFESDYPIAWVYRCQRCGHVEDWSYLKNPPLTPYGLAVAKSFLADRGIYI